MRTCSIYLLLLLAGIFASCDDFLDQSPKYNLTLENAVTDYNGAKNIVNGMYSVIAKSSSFGGELAGKWASQAGIWDYNSANYNMTYKEGGTDFASIWQSWYGLVNSANAAVIALTNLDVKLYPSPETKEALLAEAKCMRAWAYANLFWMFGHWWEADDCAYGILYRDQMANLSNLQVPRITVGESYRKIFEDLEPGLKYLPDFTTPRSSYSLGATRYETIKVVVRQIAPGIATATLLSIGRAIGDAAAVLFTAGYTDNIPTSLGQPAATLPLAVFFQLSSPIPAVQERAYAAALILTIIVLILSILGRIITNRFSRNKIQ